MRGTFSSQLQSWHARLSTRRTTSSARLTVAFVTPSPIRSVADERPQGVYVDVVQASIPQVGVQLAEMVLVVGETSLLSVPFEIAKHRILPFPPAGIPAPHRVVNVGLEAN
jgi:hypothetical protein